MAWGVLGIPAAMLSFFILVTLVLGSVGGGLQDLMFSDTQGRGSLEGAWLVFARYAIAEVLVMVFLRRTRYPGPWYVRAAIVATPAELLWVPFFRSPGVSRAFLLQGVGLGLLLLAVSAATSLAMTSGSIWSRRDTGRGSPTSVLYQAAIGWAFRAAKVGVLLWVILFAAWQWQMSSTSGLPGGDVAGVLLFITLLAGLLAGAYAALAILPYSILFLLWLRFVRRHPAVEATPARRLLTTLALALPMIVVGVHRLLPPPGRRGDWPVALEAVSLVTLACWGAVWVPRWGRRIRPTRTPHHVWRRLRVLRTPAIAF